MLVLIVLAWFAVGFVNYGFTLGWFTHEFPYHKNSSVAVFVWITGPLATPGILLTCGYKYWLIKPRTYEERLKIFCETYPTLTKKEFDSGVENR